MKSLLTKNNVLGILTGFFLTLGVLGMSPLSLFIGGICLYARLNEEE